jgi:hypothetical protein
MIKNILAFGGMSIGMGLMLCLAAEPVAAQQPAAKKNWTPPKTPWGEPDLQGIWPLNHLIATPFQRPEKYGDRRLMTDEEFARRAEERTGAQPTVRVRSDTAGRLRHAGAAAHVFAE